MSNGVVHMLVAFSAILFPSGVFHLNSETMGSCQKSSLNISQANVNIEHVNTFGKLQTLMARLRNGKCWTIDK